LLRDPPDIELDIEWVLQPREAAARRCGAQRWNYIEDTSPYGRTCWPSKT
jgi:hypothetical protein